MEKKSLIHTQRDKLDLKKQLGSGLTELTPNINNALLLLQCWSNKLSIKQYKTKQRNGEEKKSAMKKRKGISKECLFCYQLKILHLTALNKMKVLETVLVRLLNRLNRTGWSPQERTALMHHSTTTHALFSPT